MASIGMMPSVNHQFVVFGRRCYSNPDWTGIYPYVNATEIAAWYFHDRIAACDWADRMAAQHFGCQVIDVDNGLRVYEMNWYMLRANVHYNVIARCDDAAYARAEQNWVNAEKFYEGTWFPRRSGVEPTN